jgi:hypothetical protein
MRGSEKQLISEANVRTGKGGRRGEGGQGVVELIFR